MPFIYAPNRPMTDRLRKVSDRMTSMGPPTIHAYWAKNHWIALEGSHRLVAAKALGLVPRICSVGSDETIAHDWKSVRGNRVSDILEYVGHKGQPYFGLSDRSFASRRMIEHWFDELEPVRRWPMNRRSRSMK